MDKIEDLPALLERWRELSQPKYLIEQMGAHAVRQVYARCADELEALVSRPVSQEAPDATRAWFESLLAVARDSHRWERERLDTIVTELCRCLDSLGPAGGATDAVIEKRVESTGTLAAGVVSRPVQEAKCANGHTWSNDFGDDWTPEVGTLCDCRGKQWGVVSRPVDQTKEEEK